MLYIRAYSTRVRNLAWASRVAFFQNMLLKKLGSWTPKPPSISKPRIRAWREVHSHRLTQVDSIRLSSASDAESAQGLKWCDFAIQSSWNSPEYTSLYPTFHTPWDLLRSENSRISGSSAVLQVHEYSITHFLVPSAAEPVCSIAKSNRQRRHTNQVLSTPECHERKPNKT